MTTLNTAVDGIDVQIYFANHGFDKAFKNDDGVYCWFAPNHQVAYKMTHQEWFLNIGGANLKDNSPCIANLVQGAKKRLDKDTTLYTSYELANLKPVHISGTLYYELTPCEWESEENRDKRVFVKAEYILPLRYNLDKLWFWQMDDCSNLLVLNHDLDIMAIIAPVKEK